MTDNTVEEISFQSFEDDCKLLGNLLNDILQREAGCKFLEKVESVRILAQVAAYHDEKAKIAGCNPPKERGSVGEIETYPFEDTSWVVVKK